MSSVTTLVVTGAGFGRLACLLLVWLPKGLIISLFIRTGLKRYFNRYLIAFNKELIYLLLLIKIGFSALLFILLNYNLI